MAYTFFLYQSVLFTSSSYSIQVSCMG